MDSTTLVTFLFKSSKYVQRVELFGSWDNFSSGVCMQRDDRKGKGNWTACPRFDRIICDGIRPDIIKERKGTLKQGGRYWYYFKLDDVNETFDPSKPNTASCPLLPGQMVNVLDIPLEVIQPPRRVSSASGMTNILNAPRMTYNPEDRYKKIHKRHPTKLPRHYRSSENLRHQADLRTPPDNEGEAVQPSPEPLLKANLSGHKSLKRVRGCQSLRQASISTSTAPQEDHDEPAIQSVPAVDPDMRLRQLRAFGPNPSFETDMRPTTRHGFLQENATPLGLGISFDDVPSRITFSTLQGLGGPVRELQTTYANQRFTYTDSEGVNWPFPQPNALAAHAQEATSRSAICHLPSPSPSAPSSPRVFQIEDVHSINGDSLNDLVSPSFSTTTASSIDQSMSSPMEPPYCAGRDDWSHSSTAAPAPIRHQSSASISSVHSNHRLYTSGYKYSTNFDPYCKSRSSSIVSCTPRTTRAAALSSRPDPLARSGALFYELPGACPSRKVSVDEPELASTDFASSVFGALGLVN